MVRLVYELKRAQATGRTPAIRWVSTNSRIGRGATPRRRAAPAPAPRLRARRTHVDVTASDLALRFDASNR